MQLLLIMLFALYREFSGFVHIQNHKIKHVWHIMMAPPSSLISIRPKHEMQRDCQNLYLYGSTFRDYTWLCLDVMVMSF